MSPLHQAQLFDPAVAKQGRRYGDAAFSLEGVRGGVASGLDLSGISFTHVTFAGLHRYRECRFTHANLRGISLTRQERPHQFFRCGFGGTDWRDARLEYTVFNQCDLSNTRWEGATLELVRFHHCELDGVDWGGISLQRSIMSDDMLADVDFSTAAAPPRNFTSAAPEQAGDGPAGDGTAGEVSAEQAPAGEMADKHAPAAGAAADAPASTAQTDPAPGAAAAGQPVKPETPLTPRQANRRSKQPARPATAPTPPEEPGT
jgi:hypothetical protein